MRLDRYQSRSRLPAGELPKAPRIDISTAPYRQVFYVGRQLAATAQDLARIAIDQKEKRDAVEFEKARVSLLKQRNDFLLNLASDPDFDKFGERLDEFNARITETVSKMNVSDNVKTRIDSFLPAFQENARFETAQLQLSKEFDHIKAEGLDLLNTAITNMDPESMERALKSMEGVVDEAEISRLRREGIHNIEWNMNVEMINANVFSWKQNKSKFPSLDETDWAKLQNTRDTIFNQKEAEYQEEVQYYLNDLLEAGALSSKLINNYAKPNDLGLRGLTPAAERMFLSALEAQNRVGNEDGLVLEFDEAMTNFNVLRDEIRSAAKAGADFSNIELKVRLAQKAKLITSEMGSTLMTLVRDEKQFDETVEKTTYDIGLEQLTNAIEKTSKYIPPKDQQQMMETYMSAAHGAMQKGKFEGMDGAKLATSILAQTISDLDLRTTGGTSGWGISIGLNNLGESLADILEFSYGLDPGIAREEVIKINQGLSTLTTPLPDIFDDLIPVMEEEE